MWSFIHLFFPAPSCFTFRIRREREEKRRANEQHRTTYVATSLIKPGEKMTNARRNELLKEDRKRQVAREVLRNTLGGRKTV